MKFTKRKLVLQDYSIWRESLKNIASEENSVWRKTTSEEKSSWRSSEADVIRSWSLTEFEELKPWFVKWCYSEDIWLQKEWKHGATAISEEFEGIGCLSTKELRKRTIVQLYNHSSTTPLSLSAIVQNNNCEYVGDSLFREWIWNCSFTGQ